MFLQSSIVSSPAVGAVLVDQYCNPLADVSLDGISSQLEEITDKVKKMLRMKNSSHPSLRVTQGWSELERNTCWNVLFVSQELIQRANTKSGIVRPQK